MMSRTSAPRGWAVLGHAERLTSRSRMDVYSDAYGIEQAIPEQQSAPAACRSAAAALLGASELNGSRFVARTDPRMAPNQLRPLGSTSCVRPGRSTANVSAGPCLPRVFFVQSKGNHRHQKTVCDRSAHRSAWCLVVSPPCFMSLRRRQRSSRSDETTAEHRPLGASSLRHRAS